MQMSGQRMRVVRCGHNGAGATAIGRAGAAQTADLEDLAAAQHLVEDVVGDGGLAAVHVLHQDLDGPVAEIRRQDHIEHSVGVRYRCRFEHGGKELGRSTEDELVGRDAHRGYIGRDSAAVVGAVQDHIGELLVPR